MRSRHRARPPGPVVRFLWFAAGADAAILIQPEARSSRVMHATFGSLVLMTSIVAAISASFAAATVLRAGLLSYAIGAVWGLVIFCIDRFLLMLIDGGSGHRIRRATLTIFRVLAALLVASAVAIPLKLRVLQAEVGARWEVIAHEQLAREAPVVQERFEARIAEVETQLADLQRQREARLEAIQNARDAAVRELEGSGGTGIRGDGKVYHRKELEAERLHQEHVALEAIEAPRRQELQAQLDSLRTARDQAVQAMKDQIDAADGLLGRLVALDALMRDSTWGSAARLVAWGLFLIVVFVETAPLLGKAMAPAGSYEHLRRRQTELEKARIDARSGLAQEWLAYRKEAELRRLKDAEMLRTVLTDEVIEKARNSDEYRERAEAVIRRVAQRLAKQVRRDAREFLSAMQQKMRRMAIHLPNVRDLLQHADAAAAHQRAERHRVRDELDDLLNDLKRQRGGDWSPNEPNEP